VEASAAEDTAVRFGDGAELGGSGGLERIVRVDLALTALFVVSAVVSAVVFDGTTQVIGVVVALAMFLIGVFTFLIAYFVAVGRSREEEIGVAELYLLTGEALPSRARRLLWLALAIQIAAALATALARPSTDGKAGSTLAFGVLVPMLGIGLNGLASARHGTFAPRRRRDTAVDDPDEHDDATPDHPSASDERLD
jgi:hypothetical protein